MDKREKHSPEEKVAAVKSWMNNEIGLKELARQFKTTDGRISEWINQFKENGVSAFIHQKNNNIYSKETKIRAVEDYLDGKGTLIEIAAKYRLRSATQLRQWIKVYNSGRSFQRKMSGGSRMKESRSTTEEERIQIAKDCIANGGNYGETALKYQVSYQQVYQWTKKYKEMGAAGLEDRRGRRKKDQTPRTELEKAQIEIERLKHELYMTQMERDLLKKLDEIERREAYRK